MAHIGQKSTLQSIGFLRLITQADQFVCHLQVCDIAPQPDQFTDLPVFISSIRNGMHLEPAIPQCRHHRPDLDLHHMDLSTGKIFQAFPEQITIFGIYKREILIQRNCHSFKHGRSGRVENPGIRIIFPRDNLGRLEGEIQLQLVFFEFLTPLHLTRYISFRPNNLFDFSCLFRLQPDSIGFEPVITFALPESEHFPQFILYSSGKARHKPAVFLLIVRMQ